MREGARKSKGRGRTERIRKALCQIAAAVMVITIGSGCAGKAYDKNAEAGLLSGRSAEEIAELEEQEVTEGMLRVSINSRPVYLNGESAGNIRIENAPGNPYEMRVTITLESGEEVYASGLIKQNYHIESAPLSKALAAGEYTATAKFYAVGSDGKDIGVVSQEIILTVME